MDRDPSLRRREVPCERRRASKCTIDDTNLANAGIGKRDDDRPGGATGAEDHRRTSLRLPIRHRIEQVLAEPEGIRVAVFDAAVRPDHDRIYRTNSPSQRLNAIDNRKSRLFMWNCQITPAKAEDRQRPKRLLYMLRPHGQRQIDAVNAGLVEPETVNGWRPRMGHRPSHD